MLCRTFLSSSADAKAYISKGAEVPLDAILANTITATTMTMILVAMQVVRQTNRIRLLLHTGDKPQNDAALTLEGSECRCGAALCLNHNQHDAHGARGLTCRSRRCCPRLDHVYGFSKARLLALSAMFDNDTCCGCDPDHCPPSMSKVAADVTLVVALDEGVRVAQCP